jgi:hypothetical protein
MYTKFPVDFVPFLCSSTCDFQFEIVSDSSSGKEEALRVPPTWVSDAQCTSFRLRIAGLRHVSSRLALEKRI